MSIYWNIDTFAPQKNLIEACEYSRKNPEQYLMASNLKSQQMKNKILLSIFAIGISISAFAGGYQVRLQGQKQTGMGLIGSPMNFGASSIFYNPGALAAMKNNYSFEVGANLINSHIIYQSTASMYKAETDNPFGTPMHLYGAAKLGDKLTLGLGFYTPYGSTTQWPEDWAGQYLIEKISLKAYFIQPSLSYNLSDKVSLGAGLVLAQGQVDVQKGLPYSTDSYVQLQGSDFNLGFNAGVYFQATPKLAIGLDYRSKIDMEVEGGEADFHIPIGLQTIVAADNKFSAVLPLPANLDFGISYQVTPKLLAAVEVNYVFWSSYKELNFTFEENGDLLDNSNPRNYKNTFIPRLGLEYQLNSFLTVRAGGYYDQTPTDAKNFSPETVSLDTWAYTFGLSATAFKNLGFELTYLGTHGQEAIKSYEPSGFEGRYKSSSSIFGFGINYNF